MTDFSTFEWAHLKANPLEEIKSLIQHVAKEFGIEKGHIRIEENLECIVPPLNIGEPSVPN
jgi:hypothetical protein